MGNINFNEEFKDNGLKIVAVIIIIVLLGIVITITTVTVVKINKGEHVKVFGLEYNIPKEHPDTLVKTIIQKADTVVKFKPSISASILPVLKNKKSPLKSTDTSKHTTSTPIQSNSGNSHVVNGINTGINGDVNVNKPRELNANDKQLLLSWVEAKKKEFGIKNNDIWVSNTPTTNANELIPQIIDFLQIKGYTIKGQALLPLNVNGIAFDTNENCLEIIIGTFKN